MDSILSLIPGRKQASSDEPSDEAIKRTHDYLRCAPSLALLLTRVLASYRYIVWTFANHSQLERQVLPADLHAHQQDQLECFIPG